MRHSVHWKCSLGRVVIGLSAVLWISILDTVSIVAPKRTKERTNTLGIKDPEGFGNKKLKLIIKLNFGKFAQFLNFVTGVHPYNLNRPNCNLRFGLKTVQYLTLIVKQLKMTPLVT